MTRAQGPSSIGVLLRIPVFRRLWVALTISSLGDWLGLLATSALAFFLTQGSSALAQGAAVSGVLLTRLAPDLLLGPVAGAVVDRLDRRKVAIIGDSLAAVLYLSIAFAHNLTWLYVAQFLVEAVGLFSTPAKQAMWVNITPRERLAVANQLNYVSVYGMVPVAALLFAVLSTVATFFGDVAVRAETGFGGQATSATAVTIALVLDAGTYLVAAATVFWSRSLIPPFTGERSTSQNIFRLIGEGISFVSRHRLMRSIYIGILGAFGGGGLVAGVALPYVTSLGAGDAGFSILFGSVFTGLALGMLVGPKVLPNVPRRMVFTSAIGLAGMGLLAMSLLQDLIGAVVAAAVMGLFAGIAWITGFTMIGHEVSDRLRGRVFAFVMSSVRIVLLGTIALGPVLAGAIGSHQLALGGFRMDFSGPAIVLAIGGVIAVAVSVVAGRQIGGITSGLVRRFFRRQNIWDERDDHAGVLVVVEGVSPQRVASVAHAVSSHLHEQQWHTVDERFERHERHQVGLATAASALRATADLAEFAANRLRPALQAGAVVVCQGFVDALVVRFRTADGQPEDRLARTALWAVGGLRPDLTIVVDEPAPGAGSEGLAADPGGSAEEGEVVERLVEPDGAGPGELGRLRDGLAEAAAGDPATAGPVSREAARATEHDEVVDPAQAYRDRASYTPERYVVVRDWDVAGGELSIELRERLISVLRERSPVLAEAGAASLAGPVA